MFPGEPLPSRLIGDKGPASSGLIGAARVPSPCYSRPSRSLAENGIGVLKCLSRPKNEKCYGHFGSRIGGTRRNFAVARQWQPSSKKAGWRNCQAISSVRRDAALPPPGWLFMTHRAAPLQHAKSPH